MNQNNELGGENTKDQIQCNSSEVTNRTLLFLMEHGKEGRQNKINSRRQMNNMEALQYEGLKFHKFIPIV